MPTRQETIPTIGYCRIQQLLAVIPVGKSTLWKMVAEKRFPQPLRPSPFGPGITVWNAAEVRSWIENAGGAQ